MPETRRETLRRYAILLRLQDRGSPSVASPFDREKCHWHFSFVGLTPVGSLPVFRGKRAVSETSARFLYRAAVGVFRDHSAAECIAAGQGLKSQCVSGFYDCTPVPTPGISALA
jgi:hypothetical protein